MREISFGVLLTALASLILELMLTRVFDIVLVPNMSYAVVTMAVFGFGLAGVYAALRPIAPERNIRPLTSLLCLGFAAATLILIPLINVLPLDYQMIKQHTVRTAGSFTLLYLALILPFFLGGYVLILVFSAYAARIQRLYFWDLIGAGTGSLLVIPFLAKIGPGGLMVSAAALGLIAAAFFSEASNRRVGYTVAAAVLIAIPLVMSPEYIDFKLHMDKRGLKTALEQGKGEFVRWDPISKINVVDQTLPPPPAKPTHLGGDRKAIQYDGGNQTSFMYKFDGNLQRLRAKLDADTSHVDQDFWYIEVLAAEYLKRDSGQSVLVIGSAGGQETKAALVYGASHVDAVEMVSTVVDLVTHEYKDYIGDIFHDPRVTPVAGEGRSFLRHSGKIYDIIQVFSNHTSSSTAAGTGAMSPVYLQTAEAYQEYFTHLSANGVVQLNHVGYPREITTAALAWRRLGRSDFQRHVAVFYSPTQPSQSTVMIKMQPWTAEEIDSLSAFLAQPSVPAIDRVRLVENPLDPSKSFLSSDFYSGDFPQSLADRMPYYATPRTDDRPYFRFMRKHAEFLMPDRSVFVDPGTATDLNTSLSSGLPMDWLHLFLTGGASLIFVCLFVFVPLRFSAVGRQAGAAALPLLTYFSCLGAGFISIELVFIQKFMHLIGSPLYTYSTVIATMLLSAGLGSAMSERLGINSRRLWAVPFIGVLLFGTLLVLIYPWAAHLALSLEQWSRILVSFLLIFPLGFFLGMPFPIGVLAIADKPNGAVAWAWGMNGLFTVVGGLGSVLLSLFFGFNAAIYIALSLYALALLIFRPMRDSSVAVTYSVEAAFTEVLPVSTKAAASLAADTLL
jgi:spermidine synthase